MHTHAVAVASRERANEKTQRSFQAMLSLSPLFSRESVSAPSVQKPSHAWVVTAQNLCWAEQLWGTQASLLPKAQRSWGHIVGRPPLLVSLLSKFKDRDQPEEQGHMLSEPLCLSGVLHLPSARPHGPRGTMCLTVKPHSLHSTGHGDNYYSSA